MNKIILLLILVSCTEYKKKDDFNSICLDGISYWQQSNVISYRGFLAVRIDSTTLEPKECDE